MILYCLPAAFVITQRNSCSRSTGNFCLDAQSELPLAEEIWADDTAICYGPDLPAAAQAAAHPLETVLAAAAAAQFRQLGCHPD